MDCSVRLSHSGIASLLVSQGDSLSIPEKKASEAAPSAIPALSDSKARSLVERIKPIQTILDDPLKKGVYIVKCFDFLNEKLTIAGRRCFTKPFVVNDRFCLWI